MVHYEQLGSFVTELPDEVWNTDADVFDEKTLQLHSWARSEWARKYAPIPALKGVHTTTQNAKLVLSTVADYCNATYRGSWPGIDTLIEETGLSRRAIQYALRALEALGLIEEAPNLAKKCPKYLAIPADKRPVFYHVYFVFDSRVITPEYRQWAEERLEKLREKYAEQRQAGCNGVRSGVQRGTKRGATGYEAGCNEVPSGVQRVAYKTSTKQLSKSNNETNRENNGAQKVTGDEHAPDGATEAESFPSSTDALNALSTSPDRAHAERLADSDPAMKRLREEIEFLNRGQTSPFTATSQWGRFIS
ncbi:helix-turn-helix domain-containing protein [Corynebacterium riegelii]